MADHDRSISQSLVSIMVCQLPPCEFLSVFSGTISHAQSQLILEIMDNQSVLAMVSWLWINHVNG